MPCPSQSGANGLWCWRALKPHILNSTLCNFLHSMAISSLLKIKVSLIRGHEGPRRCGCKEYTYSQPQNYEEIRWLTLCSTVFTPGKLWYSFYRRLRGLQDQSWHKGVKKNLHPSSSEIEPESSSPYPSALPLGVPRLSYPKISKYFILEHPKPLILSHSKRPRFILRNILARIIYLIWKSKR